MLLFYCAMYVISVLVFFLLFDYSVPRGLGASLGIVLFASVFGGLSFLFDYLRGKTFQPERFKYTVGAAWVIMFVLMFVGQAG